jgi:hypothetical protein
MHSYIPVVKNGMERLYEYTSSKFQMIKLMFKLTLGS